MTWIACADRLPEMEIRQGDTWPTSERVLVYAPGETIFGTVQIMSLSRVRADMPMEWSGWGPDEEGNSVAFDEVTHWMPLPEPPRRREWLVWC